MTAKGNTMNTRTDWNNCRYCGREVIWTTSKAGKRYLAEPTSIIGEEGFRVIKTIYPAHRCPVTAEERKRIDADMQREHQAAVDRGEIVRGQIVEIVKGRKYPLGTIGYIDWIAQEEVFNVIKIRMELASGDKIYVNRANVEVVHECARRMPHYNDIVAL